MWAHTSSFQREKTGEHDVRHCKGGVEQQGVETPVGGLHGLGRAGSDGGSSETRALNSRANH